MMAAPAKRHRSRRRVAALNFLSNISLDGSHKDTNYAIFQRKGLFDSCGESYAGGRSEAIAETENPNDESLVVRVHAQDDREGDTNSVEEEESTESTENSDDKFTAISASKRNSGSPGASSYSGERPQNKRRLYHTFSISEGSPTHEIEKELQDLLSSSSSVGTRVRHRSTSSSASSMGSGPKQQREVRFIKPDRHKNIKKERVVLLSGQKAPFVIFSALPYNKDSGSANRPEAAETVHLRHPSGTNIPGKTSSSEGLMHLGLTIERVEDGQDISYSQFLIPSKVRPYRRTGTPEGPLQTITESAQSSPDQESAFAMMAYDPNILDDPELRSGKHRTLMTFPSYMTSVIDYVKPSDLKKELNEKFKEKFPQIQLSLSKLRSLKRDMRKIGHIKCGVDLWTVATSYVFFEKVILKGLISKSNRKLTAGACLMLSAKLNDTKGSDLTKLINEIEDTFKLHRKDLLAFEFAVLVALEFSLHIQDTGQIYPHHQRLLYTS